MDIEKSKKNKGGFFIGYKKLNKNKANKLIYSIW
jgi:hypothetical protein